MLIGCSKVTFPLILLFLLLVFKFTPRKKLWDIYGLCGAHGFWLRFLHNWIIYFNLSLLVILTSGLCSMYRHETTQRRRLFIPGHPLQRSDQSKGCQIGQMGPSSALQLSKSSHALTKQDFPTLLWPPEMCRVWKLAQSTKVLGIFCNKGLEEEEKDVAMKAQGCLASVLSPAARCFSVLAFHSLYFGSGLTWSFIKREKRTCSCD